MPRWTANCGSSANDCRCPFRSKNTNCILEQSKCAFYLKNREQKSSKKPTTLFSNKPAFERKSLLLTQKKFLGKPKNLVFGLGRLLGIDQVVLAAEKVRYRLESSFLLWITWFVHDWVPRIPSISFLSRQIDAAWKSRNKRVSSSWNALAAWQSGQLSCLMFVCSWVTGQLSKKSGCFLHFM